MMRKVLAGMLVVCLGVIALGAMRLETSFADPDVIFWWFGGPASFALIASVLWISPPQGRLAFATMLLTAGMLEGGTGLYRAWTQPSEETWIEREYYQADPVLGWAPKPSIATRAWKRVAGQTVYDVHYTIDPFARRATPTPAGGVSRQFLLLVGDSFAFGEGVNDDETLAHFVAEQAPGVRAYNYGFHGYGPQHLLARLESNDLRTQVTESTGTLVYLFIDAHVIRTIGSLIVYAGWADDAPHYVLGHDGNPVRDGTFTTGRPIRSILYSVLGRSQILKHFNIDVPLSITASHIELTASVLAESTRRFREQFGTARFAVVMFPGSKHAGRMGKALAEHGVEVLDYSELFDYDDPSYSIPKDWHPSPRAHQLLAQQLVRDLNLGFPQGHRSAATLRTSSRRAAVQ